MMIDYYTYRVTWSAEDREHVGLCADFPSLSWLADTPDEAFSGIRNLVREVIADMETAGEVVPEPLTERSYSGTFSLRVPPDVHRDLALRAAENGISLNRLVNSLLTQ